MMSISRSQSSRQLGMWTRYVSSPGSMVNPRRERMRLISSALSFSPRIRCTSRRSSTTGARSSLRATTSITSPTSVPPPDASMSSATLFVETTVDSKSAPGVGVNAVPLRHAAHGDWVPPRGFDQDVFRTLGDHRIEAAHHASEPDGLSRVGYDQVFGGELTLDAIESLESFAVPGAAYDQPAAFEQIEIEYVRGLATLPQNVVGSVNGVTDGPLIKQLQATGNLRGRGLDGSTANFARCEARTELRLLNVDGDLGFALRRRQLRFDRLERQIVKRRGLASHAIMIHGIGTVGRDLHLEDSVVAFAGDALDGNARKSKFVRKTSVVDRKVNEVTQPMRRDFHVRR